MFDVAGISTGVTASSSGKSTSISDNSNLDQDAFLTLLVAELQYQDPLEPMENQEYISQLTGFSSLDELRSISSALEDQQAAAATNLNAQSIGLIGREVTVIDESIEHTVGGKTTIQFQLPSDTEVAVEIYNSKGVLVRTDTVASGSYAGLQTYEFDGKNDNGSYLPSGTYYVQVASKPDSTGAVTYYSVYKRGIVSGVDFTGSATMLGLQNGQRVALAHVAGVRPVDAAD
jgi:flagellar basal-body rod modification protein FlgD